MKSNFKIIINCSITEPYVVDNVVDSRCISFVLGIVIFIKDRTNIMRWCFKRLFRCHKIKNIILAVKKFVNQMNKPRIVLI